MLYIVSIKISMLLL